MDTVCKHAPPAPAARAAGGSMVMRLCRSGGRKGLPLGRGECLHRQRVDLSAHSIAQRRIDALVALHPRLAVEIGSDDLVFKLNGARAEICAAR